MLIMRIGYSFYYIAVLWRINVRIDNIILMVMTMMIHYCHFSHWISMILKSSRGPNNLTFQELSEWNLKSNLNFIQEAQLLLGDRATRKHAKYCWNGRENDNLGWNDLLMYFKVIKSDTNRKLVYDFLLVVYSNFCRITHRFRKIWCETV